LLLRNKRAKSQLALPVVVLIGLLPLLPAVRSLRKKHPQKPDITAPLGLAPRLFLKLRHCLIFSLPPNNAKPKAQFQFSLQVQARPPQRVG
jgi:hypothetical protein